MFIKASSMDLAVTGFYHRLLTANTQRFIVNIEYPNVMHI